MTKKRFVAIGVEWTDGFIQDHIDDRDLFNIGAVCNLLNELSDENEQLKQKNDNLTNMIAKVQYRADLSKEENERLKQLLQKNTR